MKIYLVFRYFKNRSNTVKMSSDISFEILARLVSVGPFLVHRTRLLIFFQNTLKLIHIPSERIISSFVTIVSHDDCHSFSVAGLAAEKLSKLISSLNEQLFSLAHCFRKLYVYIQ
jgi:hypothetical protein